MSSDAANPFASPTAETDCRPDRLSDDVLSKQQRRQLQIGEVIVAWEKRRGWYNLALGCVSVPTLFFGLLASEFQEVRAADFMFLIACVIGANACYLAGPVVEGYWTWFLGPASWMRNVLFGGGTAFACMLATAVCWLIFLGEVSPIVLIPPIAPS